MNIEGLNLKPLTALRSKVLDLLPIKKREEKVRLRARLQELATSHGFTLDEVLKGTRRVDTKTKRGRRPMKDTKTGAIYYGRGRPPQNFRMERAEPMP